MEEKDNYAELRKGKIKVETNAKTIDKMVDQIVNKYSRDLTNEIGEVKALLDRRKQLTDEEIENLVMRVPVYMYFAIEGVETLGIESDMAKQVRQEVYANKYMLADGTVKDKESEAHMNTLNEQLIEIAFNRAYKKLKLQIDKAEAVFTGAKKVLSHRMQIFGVHNKDKDS